MGRRVRRRIHTRVSMEADTLQCRPMYSSERRHLPLLIDYDTTDLSLSQWRMQARIQMDLSVSIVMDHGDASCNAITHILFSLHYNRSNSLARQQTHCLRSGRKRYGYLYHD